MAEINFSYSSQEMEAAFQGPAPFSNKMLVTANPITMRLTFLEVSQDGVAHYRSAVSLAHADVVALRDLLSGMIDKVESQQKATGSGFAT